MKGLIRINLFIKEGCDQMKAGIMQPTFLPWLGYFAMIDKVQRFVYLDDVQLVKRSWQVRNKINFQNKEFFLSVPVIKQSRNDMLICKVRIDYEQKWIEKHLNTIKHSYSKYPYFHEVFSLIEQIYSERYEFIADLNIAIINKICKLIGITTPCYRSSDIVKEKAAKDELLSNICISMGCNEYLSARGSADYIEAVNPGGAFSKNNIALYYQNYEHPTYKNFQKEFIPFLSIVDLLFNVGFDNALEVIRSGNRDDIHYIDFRKNYLNL